MLIRFTDDYVDDIFRAYETVGQIQQFLCQKEPFMGNSQALDRLYALSLIISGLADHLSWDDNSEPKENEAFLLCLRKHIDKAGQLCSCRRPVIDVRNLHNKPAATEVVHQVYRNYDKLRQ